MADSNELEKRRALLRVSKLTGESGFLVLASLKLVEAEDTMIVDRMFKKDS